MVLKDKQLAVGDEGVYPGCMCWGSTHLEAQLAACEAGRARLRLALDARLGRVRRGHRALLGAEPLLLCWRGARPEARY